MILWWLNCLIWVGTFFLWHGPRWTVKKICKLHILVQKYCFFFLQAGAIHTIWCVRRMNGFLHFTWMAILCCLSCGREIIYSGECTRSIGSCTKIEDTRRHLVLARKFTRFLVWFGLFKCVSKTNDLEPVSLATVCWTFVYYVQL